MTGQLPGSSFLVGMNLFHGQTGVPSSPELAPLLFLPFFPLFSGPLGFPPAGQKKNENKICWGPSSSLQEWAPAVGSPELGDPARSAIVSGRDEAGPALAIWAGRQKGFSLIWRPFSSWSMIFKLEKWGKRRYSGRSHSEVVVDNAAVLHTVRTRYRRSDIYTFVSKMLIAVNPFKVPCRDRGWVGGGGWGVGGWCVCVCVTVLAQEDTHG